MNLICATSAIPGKPILLQTKLGNDIQNWQPSALSQFWLNQAQALPAKYPSMDRRSGPDAAFNCHGLTFASRRTCIELPSEVLRIIKEDGYNEVPTDQIKPGDIIIYFDENGDAEHSGVVLSPPCVLGIPQICSKWGGFGEVVHAANYGPYNTGIWKFYRMP